MKKIITLFLATAVAASSLCALSGCVSRDKVLKIYNWGDYMDESLCDEFEDWYAEKTGLTVSVEYDTFDTNEDMITRIEVQQSDYDLVCPSDYMAERMIKSGLAQKVDKTVFDIGAEGVLYDGLAEMVSPFDGQNEYFVPYVWGTFGIMYDTNAITAGEEKMNSWSALWSQEYSKKILMKDSVRDAYSVARIYQNREKLAALSNNFTDYNAQYMAELKSYFTDVTDGTIEEAKTVLSNQKPLIAKYEVDDGKNDMLAGTTQAQLGLFWSCDAGLIMNEEGGDHFYYTVPKEGSNVWVDGWLIPKYAGNTKAANYFLQFINSHEYATKNFDYLGTSVAQKSVMDEAKKSLEEDDEFFADFYDGFKEMYIDMMFPTAEILSRCAVMRDFGTEMNTKLDSMWIDVKTK